MKSQIREPERIRGAEFEDTFQHAREVVKNLNVNVKPFSTVE